MYKIAQIFTILIALTDFSSTDTKYISSAFQFKTSTNKHNQAINITIENIRRRKPNSSISFLANREDESAITLQGKSTNEDEVIQESSGKTQLLTFITTSFLALSVILQYTNITPYPDSLIHQDQGAFLLTSILAIAFVKLCTYSANAGWVQSRDSRKIIHTFSAPLYIFVWPLFSSAYGARFFAALIPLTNALRLYTAGSGKGGGESLRCLCCKHGDLTFWLYR